jgi:hypothetical protein
MSSIELMEAFAACCYSQELAVWCGTQNKLFSIHELESPYRFDRCQPRLFNDGERRDD